MRSCTRETPDSELFLIVGGDVAAGLPQWREPERVLSLATLAVAKRRGTARAAVEAALGRAREAASARVLPDAADRRLLDDGPRSACAPGSRSATWCPTRSPSYIERHELYGGTGSDEPEEPMTPEELAERDRRVRADRKALDIVQLDLRGMIGYTDYFVICTGRTDRQAKAIHDAIHRA